MRTAKLEDLCAHESAEDLLKARERVAYGDVGELIFDFEYVRDGQGGDVQTTIYFDLRDRTFWAYDWVLTETGDTYEPSFPNDFMYEVVPTFERVA